jgi:type IV pilus assembly protein PilM
VSNNEIIDPVALGKAIKTALNQAGIKARKAICSVAGQTSLVVRIIEVPKMTPAELKETMKWEVDRHVPFAAEPIVMDYQPLVAPEDVPDGQNMEVFLAVAQEALVNRHVETIQAAGLQPVAIDLEPLAVSRALLDLSNGAGPTGTVAVVNLGASSTDISILRDGRIAFTRSIQIAGNNLTKAISDNLGRPLADSERLKLEMAAIPEDQRQAAGAGGDLFGGDIGGLFGAPEGEDAGTTMGGTFGMTATASSDPGASTASDTHSEAAPFDIAGGGFGSEAFTGTPAAPPPAVAGPVPGGNPFDAPEPAAAGGSPFESSPFGGSPFGGGGFGGESPFGPVPVGDPFGGGTAPAGAAAPAMSEEELLRTQISDSIMPVLHELVTELRRSLDFYRNRANGLGAQQIVITGGTARLGGLAEFLSANLEAPVSVGNPVRYLSAGPKTDPGFLSQMSSVIPVSVGLAVRDLIADDAPARKKKR